MRTILSTTTTTTKTTTTTPVVIDAFFQLCLLPLECLSLFAQSRRFRLGVVGGVFGGAEFVLEASRRRVEDGDLLSLIVIRRSEGFVVLLLHVSHFLRG